jgi:hypothetical protein
VQWYGKEPAAEKVMVNARPGAIGPEFQAPPFAVDVCAVESLLVHVTVPPTATVIGLGVKAVVVNVDAPVTIDAATPEPEGDGTGEGVDGDDELHPTEKPSRARSTIRKVIWSTLFMNASIVNSRYRCKLVATCRASCSRVLPNQM